MQGGLSTEKEMCVGFLYYYPKIPLTLCEASPTFRDLMSYFQIEKVE